VAVHSRVDDREALPGGPEGTESLPFSGPANRFQLHGTVEVIQPGAGGSAEPARSPAGEEIVFILDGGLEFDVGDEQYTLAKTDSLHYRTEHPRRWTNRGRRVARAVWVSLGSV
jgi:Cupin domain.